MVYNILNTTKTEITALSLPYFYCPGLHKQWAETNIPNIRSFPKGNSFRNECWFERILD